MFELFRLLRKGSTTSLMVLTSKSNECWIINKKNHSKYCLLQFALFWHSIKVGTLGTLFKLGRISQTQTFFLKSSVIFSFSPFVVFWQHEHSDKHKVVSSLIIQIAMIKNSILGWKIKHHISFYFSFKIHFKSSNPFN